MNPFTKGMILGLLINRGGRTGGSSSGCFGIVVSLVLAFGLIMAILTNPFQWLMLLLMIIIFLAILALLAWILIKFCMLLGNHAAEREDKREQYRLYQAYYSLSKKEQKKLDELDRKLGTEAVFARLKKDHIKANRRFLRLPEEEKRSLIKYQKEFGSWQFYWLLERNKTKYFRKIVMKKLIRRR